jgi:FkbM family methyltransferase
MSDRLNYLKRVSSMLPLPLQKTIHGWYARNQKLSNTIAQNAPAQMSGSGFENGAPTMARSSEGASARPAAFTGPIDLIVSPNEISFAHGTGVLLSRLLEDSKDYIAIRSRTNYGGSQRINAKEAFVLPIGMNDRKAIFAQVSEWLAPYNIRSILCAPYFETDLVVAIAAQAITNAPLGVWVMDDNCIKNNGISKSIMAEAMTRASARFAISPELKRVYESEFRKSIAVLPPMVAPSLLLKKPISPPSKQKLVMIGNVWSHKILERMANTVKEAGLQVEWLSSNPDLWAGSVSMSDLNKAGITVVPGDDPATVNAAARAASAIIIPSDPGDLGGHEEALGSMSLPTRMPFILATSGTPMIVLGRTTTAASGFVRRFDVGSTVEYDGKKLAAAVDAICKPDRQKAIRMNAANLAERFSFEGANAFVYETIYAGGRWPDERFESLFPRDSNVFGYFVDKPAPKNSAMYFGEVTDLCDRLKSVGFLPDFILDVGASTAGWSHAVSDVYPKSRFILCDPMFSRYEKVWAKPDFELVEAAISDKPGEATFSVSSDLYGSSLIKVSEIVEVVDKVTVPVKTIDQIAKQKKLTGRGLLKVDVQFAEHLVIDGALNTIKKNVDVVILELTLPRVHKDTKTLLEMCNVMNGLGFRLYDQVGGWRLPSNGELEQLDVVFVRDGLDGTIKSVRA